MKKGNKKVLIIVAVVILAVIIIGVAWSLIATNNEKNTVSTKKNSAIYNLTNEDITIICNNLKEGSLECSKLIEERRDITDTTKMGELLSVCLNKVYKEIEDNFGLKPTELPLFISRECADVYAASYQ